MAYGQEKNEENLQHVGKNLLTSARIKVAERQLCHHRGMEDGKFGTTSACSAGRVMKIDEEASGDSVRARE